MEDNILYIGYLVINTYNNELEKIIPNIAFIESIIIVILLAVIIKNVYIRKKEKKIEKVAFIDEITGERTLAKFKMDFKKIKLDNKKNNYALIEFDIDKFKLINDMWGYGIGNLLLKHISKNIKKALSTEELFCRSRDDLFIILIKYLNEYDLIKKVKDLDKNIHSFEQGEEIINSFTLNYGIYIINGEEKDLNKMLDNAAIAREETKNEIGSRIRIFDLKLQEKLIEQIKIEDQMYTSLAKKEFEVYFQPKYQINNNCLIGAEALIRWNHPNKGIISPEKFIPLFEKNGFIVVLDMYVFNNVCNKLDEWRKRGVTLVSTSINMSRVHLKNVDNFIKNISEIFSNYNIPANLIEIEITESSVFEDYDSMLEAISRLKKIGFAISLDDFGTGYSSLNILKDLPIDVIKLDKEFLYSRDKSEKGEIVIENIVRMANQLKLKVICEGVETIEQANFLNKVGCNIAQGYLYSKPVSIKEFEEKELKICVI